VSSSRPIGWRCFVAGQQEAARGALDLHHRGFDLARFQQHFQRMPVPPAGGGELGEVGVGQRQQGDDDDDDGAEADGEFFLILRFLSMAAPLSIRCGANVSKMAAQRAAIAAGSARDLLAALQARVGGDAHAQRIQLDEAAGVGLVVGAAVFVEGGDVHIKQKSVLESRDTTITLPLYSLMRTQPLTVAACGRSGFAARRAPGPPVAVVDQRGVARHQVILQVGHFAVQGDRFDGAVAFSMMVPPGVS
jgi:hypothetical protein